MEITSVHIGALHVSQTIFFCYLFKGMVVGSTNFLGMGWSHLQGLMARRLPAGSTEHQCVVCIMQYAVCSVLHRIGSTDEYCVLTEALHSAQHRVN